MSKDLFGEALVCGSSRIEGVIKNISREIVGDEMNFRPGSVVLSIPISREGLVVAFCSSPMCYSPPRESARRAAICEPEKMVGISGKQDVP